MGGFVHSSTIYLPTPPLVVFLPQQSLSVSQVCQQARCWVWLGQGDGPGPAGCPSGGHRPGLLLPGSLPAAVTGQVALALHSMPEPAGSVSWAKCGSPPCSSQVTTAGPRCGHTVVPGAEFSPSLFLLRASQPQTTSTSWLPHFPCSVLAAFLAVHTDSPGGHPGASLS